VIKSKEISRKFLPIIYLMPRNQCVWLMAAMPKYVFFSASSDVFLAVVTYSWSVIKNVKAVNTEFWYLSYAKLNIISAIVTCSTEILNSPYKYRTFEYLFSSYNSVIIFPRCKMSYESVLYKFIRYQAIYNIYNKIYIMYIKIFYICI